MKGLTDLRSIKFSKADGTVSVETIPYLVSGVDYLVQLGINSNGVINDVFISDSANKVYSKSLSSALPILAGNQVHLLDKSNLGGGSFSLY